MKILKILLPILALTFTSCKNDGSKPIVTASSSYQTTQKETIKVIPINHGTLIIESKNDILYIDPTGGKDAFNGQQTPTYILITDIHGDHLDIKTLTALPLDNTTIIAPKAVTDKLPNDLGKTQVTLNNGSSFTPKNITIEAVPMYNLRPEALKFHTKGRGNGYIITLAGERIYISGDTEDIPEMRQLKNIDKAFVCMNLPYTMTVESAASAVLELKPKQVYPYHYRGTDGFSDVVKFKSIVNAEDNTIEVLLLDWY